ncbi:MAG: TAXI family TRAP transporter solute-binding subunit [Rhizobiales bacterium]|nr:TAXI family TRAP transporter solute-binding subunit [Hyphomicrobiales bacterium]
MRSHSSATSCCRAWPAWACAKRRGYIESRANSHIDVEESMFIGSTERCKTRVMLTATVMLAVMLPWSATAETVRLFNGPPQGTWRPIAEQLKKVIEATTKDQVIIEPGGGLSNVIAVTSGKGQLAMAVSAPLFTGLEGKPPFKERLTNVQTLATLYYQPAYIMTFDDKISKLTDLKGKRVSVMPKGYAAEAMNQLVLKMVGLSYGDIREQFLGEVESADALRDNHIDAIMGMGDTNYSIAIDLASTGRLKLVSLENDTVAALQKANAGLYPYRFKAGTYSGMKTDFTTFATTVLVVARSDYPEAKARAITKGLIEALPDLQKSFNSFKGMTKETMAKDVGLPFHPGALAYFREAGIAR